MHEKRFALHGHKSTDGLNVEEEILVKTTLLVSVTSVVELDLTIFKNPTIYNIICWFAGPMGQTTRRPSIIFFHKFFAKIV